MAGERTFTEGEAYALVADAVERETAAANTTIAERDAQIVTLGNEKDALEVRATAAEEKAEQAEQALEDYKAEQEREKAAEAKRDERMTKLTEVAPKLAEDISEERATRIVAMADDEFDDYLAQLREVAGDQGNGGKGGDGTKPDPKPDATTGAVPRESAAFKGGKPGGDDKKPSVSGLFGARRAASAPAAKAS